jgi:hypothetical protein
MKSKLTFAFILMISMYLNSCNNIENKNPMNIIYLHHSTGAVIWYGKDVSLATIAMNKITKKLSDFGTKAELPSLFSKYNREKSRNYKINELAFPKTSPYGWSNNPLDYYNIWVKNAGPKPYKEEPTLEMLTKDYQVIIFKHCFPVSNIHEDLGVPDIESTVSTIANYKLQYLALRNKLHEFPKTKFILFTGAAQVSGSISEDEAKRAKEFFTWVVKEWDQPSDNIFIWDLYSLETEGGIYFVEKNAESNNDAHPNGEFAGKAVKLLFNRIIDIIDNNGNGTSLTGNYL